ncbi:hypothetical protein [Schlesneria paludicola]|nr:hypothetical protein [Schlesneria paludicola]
MSWRNASDLCAIGDPRFIQAFDCVCGEMKGYQLGGKEAGFR